MLNKAKKMKILFKISGSFEQGFGHIRRSKTLADQLAKDVTVGNISFLYDCPDEKILAVLQPYGSRLNGENISEAINYINKQNIDVLIIDELKDNLELCAALKKVSHNIKIICLDYFNYDNQFVDVIINLFNHGLSLPRPQECFKGKYYQGLEYAIIRDGFFPFMKQKKKITPQAGNILISFGGADCQGHTISALKLLAAVGYASQVDIIMGVFFRGKDEVAEYVKRQKFDSRLHENISDIEKYIYAADFGFIGSGTTIMEFCYLGTPALVMPQNSREHDFAQLFATHGAVKVLEPIQGGRVEVEHLINDAELRESMSQSGKMLVDGKGKERICQLVLERH